MASERALDAPCGCEPDIEHGDEMICRCEEVTRAEIVQAIREGARTLNEIKRRTRAGMGLCQGKTCARLVQRILAEETGRPIAEVMPATYRPPVRPVRLDVLASLEEN